MPAAGKEVCWGGGGGVFDKKEAQKNHVTSSPSTGAFYSKSASYFGRLHRFGDYERIYGDPEGSSACLSAISRLLAHNARWQGCTSLPCPICISHIYLQPHRTKSQEP